MPSSISISAATEAIGLVIDMMRKIESRSIGLPASMSRLPLVVTWATSPLRHTSVTIPDNRPWSTIACMAGPISPNSSRESPLTFTAPSSMKPSPRYARLTIANKRVVGQRRRGVSATRS